MAFALLSIAASLTLTQGPVLPQASIAGTVRDGETSAPIAGAAVVLSDLSRAATADIGGHSLLTGVPPGPQHLTVRFMGYAPRVVHALVPSGSRLVTMTPPGAKDPLLDGGKVLAVWRRQPDGSWLVSRAVRNSDLAGSDNLRPGT